MKKTILRGMRVLKPLHEWSNEELWAVFPVLLYEHDPVWLARYKEEAGAILHALGEGVVVRIRHIGSTAVPGLLAKPTIDILLEIAESSDLEALRDTMQRLKYVHGPQPENPAPHCMFLKGYTPRGFEGQCFHVHVRYHGDYEEPYFCEYLRNHPEAAAEYAALKSRLQRRFANDRDAYTQAKSEFVRRITVLARKEKSRSGALSDLRKIPGVGKKTEQNLMALGYSCIADLAGQNPEQMYERDCALHGAHIDRCQLYVYRCAVYFAEHPAPEGEKCKWWYWKDKPYPEQTS